MQKFNTDLPEFFRVNEIRDPVGALKTRLRILSDPHSGAFAVTGCVTVSLLQSAVFAELFARPVGVTPMI